MENSRSLSASQKRDRLHVVGRMRRWPTMAGCVGSDNSSSPSHVMSEQPTSEPSRVADLRHLGTLTLRSTREGDAHVLALSGELDLAGADLLDSELHRAECSDASEIVIDLRDLEFIDSTGIRLVYLADMRS